MCYLSLSLSLPLFFLRNPLSAATSISTACFSPSHPGWVVVVAFKNQKYFCFPPPPPPKVHPPPEEKMGWVGGEGCNVVSSQMVHAKSFSDSLATPNQRGKSPPPINSLPAVYPHLLFVVALLPSPPPPDKNESPLLLKFCMVCPENHDFKSDMFL